MPARDPQANKHIAAYGANDIDSLETLELSIERDEANLEAKIERLELATDDGLKVTAVTYVDDKTNPNLGHLILTQYKDDVDAHSQIMLHAIDKETFLIKGKAYVKNKPVNVLVFREKKS